MIEVFIAFLILYLKYRERLWEFNYERLNVYLLGRESRYGIIRWGLIQTGLIMAAVCFYVTPSSHCTFMGRHYAQLAADPFGFDPSNPVPHRILTSLISYAIGLRGQLIIVTNLLIAAALIFALYRYFRTIDLQPADGFMAAAFIAFSTVTLNTVYYGGYNDSLTFLLIFLMWAFRRKRVLFHVLFLLGLFNRESAVFLIPWFAFISFEGEISVTKRSVELLIGFVLSLAIYALFRAWIAQHEAIEYSMPYYLRGLIENPVELLRTHFENLWVGAFAVFKLAWVLPLAAAIAMWREGNRKGVISMLLLVLCSAAQLLVAFDTTRLLAMSFMIIPISLIYLVRTDAFESRRWVVPLFVCNLLVPNLMVAGSRIDQMQSLLAYSIWCLMH